MKLFKYGLPFAALALLASCSNDNLGEPNNGNGSEVEETYPEGTIFMTVDISLPSALGTKASLESFDEGTEDEYKVKKVDLFLFKFAPDEADSDPATTPTYTGTPEATAKFVTDIEVGFSDFENGNADDIEKVLKATFQLVNGDESHGITLGDDMMPTDDAKYYALLILNKSSHLPAINPGDTFDAWNAKIMEASTSSAASLELMKDADGYITMANAPYLKGENSSKEVVVLEEINTTKFATSPKLANANDPAATFYVQRGVAKVGLAFNENEDFTVPVQISYTGDVEDIDELDATAYKTKANFTQFVTIQKWNLDITNQGTFPVQSVAPAAAYTQGNTPDWSGAHFFTKTAGTQAASESFIWWGIDPNYSGSEESNSRSGFNNLVGTETGGGYKYEALTLTLNPDASDYCLENTMDYQRQIKNETTRVILQGLYLIADKWTAEEVADIEAAYKEEWMNEDSETNLEAGWDEAKEEWLEGKSYTIPTADKYKYLINSDDETNGTYDATTYAGMIVFNDIAIYLKATDKARTPQPVSGGKSYEYKLSELLTGNFETYRKALMMANTDQTVTFYPNAVTYYTAYIRHFDNTEADLGDDIDIYRMVNTDYQPKHLGRYGVLRNNKYEVNIMAVAGYGLPVVPPPTDTPDDKIDDLKFNALVTINILKWAKRTYDYVPR